MYHNTIICITYISYTVISVFFVFLIIGSLVAVTTEQRIDINDYVTPNHITLNFLVVSQNVNFRATCSTKSSCAAPRVQYKLRNLAYLQSKKQPAYFFSQPVLFHRQNKDVRNGSEPEAEKYRLITPPPHSHLTTKKQNSQWPLTSCFLLLCCVVGDNWLTRWRDVTLRCFQQLHRSILSCRNHCQYWPGSVWPLLSAQMFMGLHRIEHQSRTTRDPAVRGTVGGSHEHVQRQSRKHRKWVIQHRKRGI